MQTSSLHEKLKNRLGGSCIQLSVKPAAIQQEGKFWHPLFTPSIPSMGFTDSSVGKEPTCNAGGPGSIPGLGKSPGEGKAYPLQCSGLENSMDCIVHGVAKSWTQLSNFHFHCSQHTIVQLWKNPNSQFLLETKRKEWTIHSKFWFLRRLRDRILFCLSLGASEKNSIGLK